MATKMRLTGSQMRTMAQRSCSTCTKPAALHACTSATASAHWKNSSALAEWKAKEDSATLFSSTWQIDGGGGSGQKVPGW